MLKDVFKNIVEYFSFKYVIVKDKYYDIKWYFKNKKTFKQIIKQWRPWDFYYQERLFVFGLEQLRNSIVNGHEERNAANKKINAINELIYELNRDIEEEYVWDESKETLEKYSKKLYKLKVQRYNKISKLIKGQNTFDFKYDKNQTDGQFNAVDQYNQWLNWFDGSGCENWWD